MSVQLPCSLRSLRTEIIRSPCGDRPCAMPPTTCLRATVLRFFKFVKLLAQPNRRGRGARESLRKSHSRLLAEAARKGGYWQDTGSVDPSQAKCELGISDTPGAKPLLSRLYSPAAIAALEHFIQGIISCRVPIYHTWVERDNCGQNTLSKGIRTERESNTRPSD